MGWIKGKKDEWDLLKYKHLTTDNKSHAAKSTSELIYLHGTSGNQGVVINFWGHLADTRLNLINLFCNLLPGSLPVSIERQNNTNEADGLVPPLWTHHGRAAEENVVADCREESHALLKTILKGWEEGCRGNWGGREQFMRRWERWSSDTVSEGSYHGGLLHHGHVVAAQWHHKQHRPHVLEAADPLPAFRPLASHVVHPGERRESPWKWVIRLDNTLLQKCFRKRQ